MKWGREESMRCWVPSGGHGATPRSAQAIWIEPFQKPPAAPPSSRPALILSQTSASPLGCRINRTSAHMKGRKHLPSSAG